jgi:hypothetical protein
LDGPDFGFAHRLGQDAKADAIRSEGLRPKGYRLADDVGHLQRR